MLKEMKKAVYDELSGLIKGDVLCDIYSRVAFSTDASIYQIMPGCVAAPVDEADVVAIVRWCLERDVPVVGRGAGSGLAGEALGEGVVIDFKRNMNRIIGVEGDGEYVICEPGAVLDDVNDYLKRYGRRIGPDPSSGNRAVVGGVVANNATGGHSLRYGYIADYLESVRTVLDDCEVYELGNGMSADEAGGHLGEIINGLVSLLGGKEELINSALPATERNRSGYNIAGVCRDRRVDMARLMAGSEGTLGVFTQMKLRTVEVVKAKGLVQFEFDSMDSAARAVPVIVDCGADACEIMDSRLIRMAAEALPEYRDVLAVDCAASLLVEHSGSYIGEVLEKLDDTIEKVGELSSGCMKVTDECRQELLWKSRKDAVPLLYRQEGAASPIAFIEDVSVENSRLAEYVAGLERVCQKYDVEMAFYGHAGDGELHVRPFLDLSDAEDVRKMRGVAEDVFDLAWSLGGSISGEHADGLVRAAFIERQYGREYYQLLVGVKNVFDPAGLINPGKIINSDPDVMVKNLRSQVPMVAERMETELDFGGKFGQEIRLCNGDGVCLSCKAGSRMCPVYRALGSEVAGSRGKANLLRAWCAGQLSEADFSSQEFREIIDLCINCKMCSVECPSGVDVSRLIIEARTQMAKRQGFLRRLLRGPGLTERVLGRNRLMAWAAGLFSPISNFVLSLKPVRFLMEKILGLDSRRPLPGFLRGDFVSKARKHLAEVEAVAVPVDKVAYFVDSYANSNDHNLGWAVVKLLRRLGVEVIVPEQLPAPLPAFVYGDVNTARRDAAYSLDKLFEAVEDGYKVVCSEPSAAMFLRDELKMLMSGDEVERVAGSTYELFEYLDMLREQGRLKGLESGNVDGEGSKAAGKAGGDERYLYHNPCHSRAIGLESKVPAVLRELGGVDVVDVNGGCCGMAGTYGMKKKGYDLSMKIGATLTEAIDKAGDGTVITECGACKMQIEHLTGRRVEHPAKVLARAIGVK
jgi:FAD/FMN-containing dehydrogenase/Fe-S oxidoreductase